MFGRNNILKLIREGDLARLRKVVEKKPERLGEWFKWDDIYGPFSNASGNALHVAAYFNQPEIIEFLADKGMNINQRNQVTSRTPLHWAAGNGQYEATKALLELGVDLNLKNNRGQTAFDICNDPSTRELLRAAYEAEQKHEQSAPQAKEQKQPERAEPADAAAKAEGTWTLTSPDEIVHQHESPPGLYHLTDIFNFAAERVTSIVKDLKQGGQPHPVIRTFNELSKAEHDQARTKLAELTGNPVTKITPAPRQTGYADITSASL